MDFLDKLTQPLSDLFHWVQGLASTPGGVQALFWISLAESSFFPIPPDVLLIALCLGDPRRSLWFAAICTAGSVIGAVIGYGIGYWGGRPVLRRLFDEAKVAAVERYYDRYNAWAIGIAGVTPLPYKIFTLSGGACAINFRIFLLASIAARGARFFAVAGLIYLFGAPIQAFIEEYFNLLSVGFVVVLVGGFWLVGRRTKRAAARPPADEARGPAGDEPASAAPAAGDEGR